MDISSIDKDMQDTIEYLREELSQIRTGRASTELLESIKVEAYETTAPLTNYGNISVSDLRSLTVQIWDKSILDSVIKGITDADLGLSVTAEGEDLVRVTVPDLTEERRKDLVKVMKDRVEKARIGVRNVRQKYMKDIESAVKDGLSEDEGDRLKEVVEKKVKEANESIEEMKDKKEEALMKV